MKRRKIFLAIFVLLAFNLLLFNKLLAADDDYTFKWENTDITVLYGESFDAYYNKIKVVAYKNGKELKGNDGKVDLVSSSFGLSKNEIDTYYIGEYKLELIAQLREKSQISERKTIWVKVVDHISPVIKIINNDFTYELGRKIKKNDFILKHFLPTDNFSNARIIDNVDKKIDPKRIIEEELLDFREDIFNMIGEYKITYIVKDYSGNRAKKEITLKVVDKIPPKIENIKRLIIKPNQGIENYYPYFKITDNSGEMPNVKFVESGDFSFPGAIATLTVIAEDRSGNKSEMSFPIEIMHTPPIIVFSKNKEINVFGNIIEELKKLVIRIDHYEDSIYNLSDIEIDYEGLRIDVLGKYDISYKLKDKNSNKLVKESIVVNVVDKIAPEIKIEDEEDGCIKLALGEFDYKSKITASDNYDKDEEIKLDITSISKEYLKQVGEYDIDIKAYDKSRNVSAKQIKLIVFDPEKPKLIPKFEGDTIRFHVGEIMDIRNLFKIEDNYYKESDFNIEYQIRDDYYKTLGKHLLGISIYLKNDKYDEINQLNEEYFVEIYDEIEPIIYLYNEVITYYLGKEKPNLKNNIEDIYDNDTKLEINDVIIDDNEVDYNTLGRYQVKYIVYDSSYNKGIAFADLIVDDLRFPKIELGERRLDIYDFSEEKLLEQFNDKENDSYKTELVSDIPEDIKPGKYLIKYRMFNKRGHYKDFSEEVIITNDRKKKGIQIAIAVLTIFAICGIAGSVILFWKLDKKKKLKEEIPEMKPDLD